MKRKIRYRNKFELYEASVQSPETDVGFIKKVFRSIRGRSCQLLHEDFCGTYALARAWVQSSKDCRASGSDLDAEPVAFGSSRAEQLLSKEERNRLRINLTNVLNPLQSKVDCIVAMNFSYFIFKDRESLKAYFKRSIGGLVKDGIFIIDAIGGPDCYLPNEERRTVEDFYYFWDLKEHDPINNRSQFAIHFQQRGRAKQHDVFTYDWRMWSVPEIREIMKEVGFKDTVVYWEGTDRDGVGNGIFKRKTQGEACQTWIAYIVGIK